LEIWLDLEAFNLKTTKHSGQTVLFTWWAAISRFPTQNAISKFKSDLHTG